MAQSTKSSETVEQMAERLSDAFSSDRYRNGWSATIRMLRGRGYSDQQVEAIIRSKWTRWAGDHSGKRYGQVTASDLATLIDSTINRKGRRWWDREVRDLVAGTFTGEQA